MQQKQEDSMWTSFDEKDCPFYFMIGRTCLSSITLNPCTVTVLQHILGGFARGLNAVTHFFQGGVLMAYEQFLIIMNAVLLHNGVCIKIGIRKDCCKPDRTELKSLIVKSGELIDRIFTRECCKIVEEKNPSSTHERHALSLVEMMKGCDRISYPLSKVQHSFHKKVLWLHSSPTRVEKGDRTALLLTEEEKKNKDNEVLLL